MKELFIVRHAKSDWGEEFIRDIDRPLNERGYRDAYFMSKWFLKNKKIPQLILTSPATRALSTALIFARAMEFNMDCFFINENIYESQVKDLISIVNKQNDSVKSIMLFGHNPGLTDLCNKLNDDVFIDNLPTCGIVNLNFEIETWAGVSEKKASMGFFQFPKDFKNID